MRFRLVAALRRATPGRLEEPTPTASSSSFLSHNVSGTNESPDAPQSTGTFCQLRGGKWCEVKHGIRLPRSVKNKSYCASKIEDITLALNWVNTFNVL